MSEHDTEMYFVETTVGADRQTLAGETVADLFRYSPATGILTLAYRGPWDGGQRRLPFVRVASRKWHRLARIDEAVPMVPPCSGTVKATIEADGVTYHLLLLVDDQADEGWKVGCVEDVCQIHRTLEETGGSA